MNTNENRPADTRMMGIVHSALRRDLVRARILLEAGPLPADRRAALGDHLVWTMAFLHHHHSGEDTGLYPMLLDRDPSTAAILAEMDGEHRLVEPAVDVLVATAGKYRAGAVNDLELRTAVADVEAVLFPHLHREETELMPLVSAAITDREWSAWTQQMKEDGPGSTAELAFEAHWLLDGLEGELRVILLQLVPAVPRFLVLHLLGGPYRRKRALLWGGTPAEAVPALDIDAMAARS